MTPLFLADAVHPLSYSHLSTPGGGCLPKAMAMGYLLHSGDCQQDCGLLLGILL